MSAQRPLRDVPGRDVPAVRDVALDARAVRVVAAALVEPDRDGALVQRREDVGVDRAPPLGVERPPGLVEERVDQRVAEALVVRPRAVVLGARYRLAAVPLREIALWIGARDARLREQDVELAALAQSARLPGARERRVRDVLDARLDADRAPLVDEHLLDLLAQPVAGRAHDAERRAHSGFRAHAVRAREPAGALEDVARPSRVVALLRERFRRGPAVGDLGRRRTRPAEEQLLDDARLRCREQQGAPYGEVPAIRLRQVEGERLDRGRDRAQHADVALPLEIRGVGLAETERGIDLAGLELRLCDIDGRGETEDDAIERGPPGDAIARVALGGDVVAACELGDAERARPERRAGVGGERGRGGAPEEMPRHERVEARRVRDVDGAGAERGRLRAGGIEGMQRLGLLPGENERAAAARRRALRAARADRDGEQEGQEKARHVVATLDADTTALTLSHCPCKVTLHMSRLVLSIVLAVLPLCGTDRARSGGGG